MDIVDLLKLVTLLISLGYLNTDYTHMSVNVMTDLLTDIILLILLKNLCYCSCNITKITDLLILMI